MKKLFLLFLTIGAFASCSKDDKIDEPVNNSIEGNWTFSKSYVNYYNADKKLIKTLNVRTEIDNSKELFRTDEAVVYMKSVNFQTGNKYTYTSTFDNNIFNGIYSISDNIIDFKDPYYIDNFEFQIENGVLTTDNIGLGTFMSLSQYKPSEFNQEAIANITDDYKFWRMFVEYKRIK